jgi:hypothetical protein
MVQSMRRRRMPAAMEDLAIPVEERPFMAA